MENENVATTENPEEEKVETPVENTEDVAPEEKTEEAPKVEAVGNAEVDKGDEEEEKETEGMQRWFNWLTTGKLGITISFPVVSSLLMKIFKTELNQKILWLREFGLLPQWKIADNCNISRDAVGRVLKYHKADKIPRRLLKESKIGIKKLYFNDLDEKGEKINRGKATMADYYKEENEKNKIK